MRYFAVFVSLAWCATAWGQTDAPAARTEGLQFSGSIMERNEFWDWFPANTGTTQYSFSGSLLQFAVSQKRQSYDWMVDFAAPVLLDLPDHASGPAPLGQYGLGANYFAANQGNTNAAGFLLKQGFFRLKGERSSVRLGRFEFAEGMEGKAKDATLGALKTTRLQQHLIA